MGKLQRLLLIFTVVFSLIITGCGSKNDSKENSASKLNDVQTEEKNMEKSTEKDKDNKKEKDKSKQKDKSDKKEEKKSKDKSKEAKKDQKKSNDKESAKSTESEEKTTNNTSASKAEPKKSSSSSNNSASDQKKSAEPKKEKKKNSTTKKSEEKATNNNSNKSSSNNSTSKKEQTEKQEQFVTVSVTIPSGVSKGSGLSPTKVTIKDGDSILDATKKTSLDVNVSGGGSMAYVRGINGLKEFDEGPLSGWQVKVNGTYIDRSAGAYKAASDQKIEWIYTTDYTKN